MIKYNINQPIKERILELHKKGISAMKLSSMFGLPLYVINKAIKC